MMLALVLSALTASSLPNAPYFEQFCKSHHAGKFYTVIYMPNGDIADIGCATADFEKTPKGWKRIQKYPT